MIEVVKEILVQVGLLDQLELLELVVVVEQLV